jgi:hypothetical protein
LVVGDQQPLPGVQGKMSNLTLTGGVERASISTSRMWR